MFVQTASMEKLMEFLNFVRLNKAKQCNTRGYHESFPRHAKIGSDEARHGKAFEGLLNRYFKK